MLPEQRQIELPLIKEIAKRGGRTDPSDKMNGQTIFEALAIFFNLSQSDLDQINESDKRSKWENRVRFVRKDLVDLGVISNSLHGIWELTEKGKKIAEFIEDISFTHDYFEQLTSKEVRDCIKEIYHGLINTGMDKVQALKLVKANDCESILKIMEKN